MKINQFNFILPKRLIASRPVIPRTSAKLLKVTADGQQTDDHVSNLPDLLHPGDILVVNDTRVIPAYLIGFYNSTTVVRVLLHKQVALNRWRAFVSSECKLLTGQSIRFSEDLSAIVKASIGRGETELHFNYNGPDFTAALSRYGRIPLPPYIQRPCDARDHIDYQTVFARVDGSIAAPTAGLHLTRVLLTELETRNIQLVAVTLHIGASTFLPIRADNTCEHVMYAESGSITNVAATIINQRRGKVVAVGTTTLRLLESATTPDGILHPFSGDVVLFITPGYTFRIVDKLLTNFHLPMSTLCMLVAAFIGFSRMHDIYAHAIRTQYRFYSYGDACLLDRKLKNLN